MTCVCGHEFCWHCSNPWSLKLCPTYSLCPFAVLYYAAPTLYLARAVVRDITPLRKTWDFIYWLLSFPWWACHRILMLAFSGACWIFSCILGFPMSICKKAIMFIFHLFGGCISGGI